MQPLGTRGHFDFQIDAARFPFLVVGGTPYEKVHGKKSAADDEQETCKQNDILQINF